MFSTATEADESDELMTSTVPLPIVLHGPAAKFANAAYQIATESGTLAELSNDLNVCFFPLFLR